MDCLSEGLRAALTPAMAQELQQFLADMAEEAQEKECTLNMVLMKLLQDLKELEHTRRTEVEQRQKERERMAVASAAAKRQVQEQNREALTRLKSEAERKTKEYEKEREKRYALERELKRVNALLELKEDEDYDKLMAKETERMIEESKLWNRRTKESEDCTLTITLAAAFRKQKQLRDLKNQAEEWMVSGRSAEGVRVPLVFQSWKLREEWRKLQDNKACLNDGLQNFVFRKEIENVIGKNQKVTEQIDAKFRKKMEDHMTQVMKRQEKIRTAELKKRMKLEEQLRKELAKIQKAKLKEKERQVAKEKKQAQRLERKMAKEERVKARTVLHFWR